MRWSAPLGMWSSIAAGIGLGLVAFGVETAMILRSSAIGVNVDLEGPYAALLAAVRPHLPGLFGRILLVYVAAGAVFGLAAGALRTAVLWGSPRAGRAARWAVWAMEILVLVGLLAWNRAIHRPALFDDLEVVRPVLRALVTSGEPWHPVLGLGGWLSVHAAVFAWRVRRFGFPASGAFVRWALVPIALVAVLLPASIVIPAARKGSAEGARRLVLLVGIDAFRPDRLSAMGGQGGIAPHLERLISEGTLFTNAWTPIAQTEPAWRSLVTARWPYRTGVRYPLTAESRWLPAPTFPQALSRAGWHTAFATDCSRFNFQTSASGFEARHQPPRGAINFVLEKLRYRGLGMVGDNAVGASIVPELLENRALAGLYDPEGYATRLAQRIVEAAGEGDTFFSFHSTAAHFPGDPVHPFYRRYVREDAPFHRRLRMFFSPITGASKASGSGWTREDTEALYDELLAQADAQLGIVLDALKRRGLYDEATIIVFSDHGESFHADHPELAAATPVHGARLSREENQILLAVKLPRSQRATAPRKVDALVRLIDIGPTILELAGLESLPGADGESLVPLLEGAHDDLGLRLYAETGFTHASPDAFDPGHLARASRSFEVYRVRPDGVVELNDRAHAAVLEEKDVGVYDGRRWLIRSPRADGSVQVRCEGECPAPALEGWLSANGNRE